MLERKFPPVTEIGAASMVLVIVAVIDLAAYLPKHAPLTLPIILLCLSAALFVANLVILARLGDFAWWRFSQVARWALLAYVIIAGMLEFTFIYDGTRGGLLAVMTMSLLLFTLNVPVLLAFTVARFQTPAHA
jgi:hypothetical protein